MEREVRYCTTKDGVRIAYTVFGDGYPVVFQGGMFSDLRFLSEDKPVALFFQRMGRCFRVVTFDHRGSGLSDREAQDLSILAKARDIEAVVADAQLQRFALWAWSGNAPAGIAYAAENPDSVHKLVLYGAYARSWSNAEAADAMARMLRTNWRWAARMLTTAEDPGSSPEYAEDAVRLLRRTVSVDFMVQTICEIMTSVDVRHLASGLRVPTLVLHRRADSAIPFECGRELASLIPAARFLALEGREHTPSFGDMDLVFGPIEEFLSEETGGCRSASVVAQGLSTFRTVLFTDLVGHTQMMSRLGDDAGRVVLREHETITRNVLKQHGGTEVKTMGDGFMASFGSVTRAVECAIALQHAFADREGEPLNVRVGLNAGEPIEEDGDLFGATVILASRIAAKAEGGEILVADTVRGLCSGKGFLFADRGEFVAKGFEEPVRVYEVRWRR
ncbi:MAG TPA: adenylate/guanylate cyclase domain-containing protein [Dehalococcoidia bacterium]|jgi:class 3 adenylate cyclase|nr:adenylate/guanylate cyclase domain-containing protein [Dehalococcoidia bacterium]